MTYNFAIKEKLLVIYPNQKNLIRTINTPPLNLKTVINEHTENT